MSLQVNNLVKSYGTRTLFSDVTFPVNPGERVALVGNNGSGKTTLMKIILGRAQADGGQVVSPRESIIGYLPQEIFLAREDDFWQDGESSATLWDLVSQAFSRLMAIEKQLEEIDNRISEGDFSCQELRDSLQIEFEKAGGYNWQARMKRVLKGLGFPEQRFHDPLKHFSGGWQMRAYFARLLLGDPDFLLLDEPTNYLDIASIQFLEEYLSTFAGGILVVSHDRYFLDNLATSVIALTPDGARVFRGNYSEFLLAREIWTQEADAAQKRQDKEIQRIQRFVERFRYKNTKATQVQSRIKMLEKLERVQTFSKERTLGFSFVPCQESGDVIVQTEGISRDYGPNKVLNDVGFSVNKGDRLAIIGENGTGKTTLMRILAGQDLAFSGKLDWGYRVMPGYFAQDEEISFEKEETVWERMLRESPIDRVPQLRNLLGMFLFSGDMVERKVKALSGGEKSRLGLARLLLHPCNLLLLDEPTNHLDLSSREALLDALDTFPGTIIIVSHDRFFLDSLATRVVALDNGKATVYDGDYGQYVWARKHRLESREEQFDDSPKAGNESPETQHWKERKRTSNQIKRWEKEIEQVEGLISTYEDKLKTIEDKLAFPPPGISPEDLKALSFEHSRLQKDIAQTLNRWEELHKNLEGQNQPFRLVIK